MSPFGLLFKGPDKFLGENMVCCKYLKRSEGLNIDFYTFKLSIDEDILKIFNLATVLATFSKIWVIFPQSSGHPAYWYGLLMFIKPWSSLMHSDFDTSKPTNAWKREWAKEIDR